jgi:hypothetical protein
VKRIAAPAREEQRRGIHGSGGDDVSGGDGVVVLTAWQSSTGRFGFRWMGKWLW